MNLRWVGLCLLILSKLLVHAQTPEYYFINDSLNVIKNAEKSMQHFYQKLHLLKSGNNLKVSVLHIGDSHIQGDFFPKKVRHGLQYYFGNAGRGLIFPLKLAKTNEPLDFKILSNVDWLRKKNLSLNNPLPIGICGYTLRSESDTSFLKLMLLEKDSIEYCFNKFTLIHHKGDTCFSIELFDGENQMLGTVHPEEIGMDVWASTFETDTLLKDLTIKAKKVNLYQNVIQIYGLLLENEKPGIIHHAVGVNGADFFHFNRSALFFEQLPILEPDLIIVSLGTNEALYKGFKQDRFEAEVKLFYDKLTEACPNASILFTTPGDCSPKKIPNKNIVAVKNCIVNFAFQNNVASWDLHSIMGGTGSINIWYKKGLSLSDRIHLNKKGYELQGKLLLNALMDGFRLFENRF